jgi:Na+/H+-dicarboxylate symporter
LPPDQFMAKSKLTLYIFIALILGVIAGYVYNVSVIGDINSKINTADANIKSISTQIVNLKDTITVNFKALKLQKAAQVNISSANNSLRDDKLEFFSILSKIFLNLIKMIVAPLVFSTLVVGVAKVGDISSVGRIGGKTLLWFLSATLVSLLLGMLLVNFFEPGVAMHLPLPDSHLNAGVQKSGLSLNDFVDHLFPKSFFEAMTANNILGVVVFSLFFGVATAAIGPKGEGVIKVMDAIAHIILKII